MAPGAEQGTVGDLGAFTRLSPSEAIRMFIASFLKTSSVLLISGATSLTTTAKPNFQQVVRTTSVGAEPTCTECKIDTRQVATIGKEDDPIDFTPQSKLSRDQRGRYYLWSTERASIAVYDSAGSFLTSFGRWGKGPGEFENKYRPIVPLLDGSVAVIQLHNISYFDPSYKLIRTVAVSAGSALGSAVAMPNGELIVGSHIRTPNRVGLPLQAISKSGQLRLSFGGASADFDARRCGSCDMRFVTSRPSTDAEVWVAHSKAYVIERWTTHGKLLQRLKIVNSDWWPDNIGEKMESGIVRPNNTTPSIRGIWADANGLLYVVGTSVWSGTVVQEEPSRKLEPLRPKANGPTLQAANIDVIDPVRGVVLKSHRFAAPMSFGVIGSGFVYLKRELSSGAIVAEVKQVSFDRQR